MKTIFILMILSLFVQSNFATCVYPMIDGTPYGQTGCVCDRENYYAMNENDPTACLLSDQSSCVEEGSQPYSINPTNSQVQCECGYKYKNAWVENEGFKCQKCPDNAFGYISSENTQYCKCLQGYNSYGHSKTLQCTLPLTGSNIQCLSTQKLILSTNTCEECPPGAIQNPQNPQLCICQSGYGSININYILSCVKCDFPKISGLPSGEQGCVCDRDNNWVQDGYSQSCKQVTNTCQQQGKKAGMTPYFNFKGQNICNCSKKTYETENSCENCPPNSYFDYDSSQQHCFCIDGANNIGTEQSPVCTLTVVCESVLRLNLSNNSCVACPANAIQDPDNNQICKCKSGFTPNNSGDNLTCIVQCNSTQRLDRSNNTCVACPSHSRQNSQDETLCTCPSGFDSANTGASLTCTCPNTYRYNSSDNTCVACPSHSEQNSLDETLCSCLSGFDSVNTGASLACTCPNTERYNSSNNTCVACPSHSRQNSQDETLCSCPSGFDSANTGASLTCTCPNTHKYKLSNNTCVACTTAAVQDSDNEQLCSCPPGYNSNGSGDSLTCTSNTGGSGASQSGNKVGPNLCHPSCNCKLDDGVCATCYKCDTCKQPTMADKIENDFCLCRSPQYRLVNGSEYLCEANTEYGNDNATCKYQLFNTIKEMVIHSNCSVQKNSSTNITYVHNELQFDWARVTGVGLDQNCKDKMVIDLKIQADCNTSNTDSYTSLSTTYYSSLTDGDGNRYLDINIKLIDVYSLTNVVVTTENRYINQRICLALDLSNGTNTVRFHRFEMRVYTNRDQVKTFHLDVDKQITDGCDRGQQCVVVANLDTEGTIMEDDTYTNPKTYTTPRPQYVVGDYMYVKIVFKDTTYNKYLYVTGVTFVDDDGIYAYVENTQYWFYQSAGRVNVKILLFQPQTNATVQIAMKIRTTSGRILRNMEVNQTEETISKNFQTEVLLAKEVKPFNQIKENDTESIFAEKLLFTLASIFILFLLV